MSHWTGRLIRENRQQAEEIQELKERNNFLARIMRENRLHEANCKGGQDERRNAFSSTYMPPPRPCTCWLSVDLDLTT